MDALRYTNTSTNILQYRECQINANRWEDKMHLHLFLSLSSIKAASHWFIQTNCRDDYQLSPKRFMIVTVTSVESNAVDLADFMMTLIISPRNPRPKPQLSGVVLIRFWWNINSNQIFRWVFDMSRTTCFWRIFHLVKFLLYLQHLYAIDIIKEEVIDFDPTEKHLGNEVYNSSEY